jgi:integrase
MDLGRGRIHVLRHKTGKAFVISIYPQLRPLIERLVQQNPKAAPTDPVFRVRNPKRALATACRQLKFPQFSPRSFRRMFITRCLEHGMDPGLVARTQGHSDGGALILKTYRHIRPSYEAEMLERLKDE